MPDNQISKGHAVTEYELVLPNSAPVPIPDSWITQEQSDLTESIYGPAVYSHRLRATKTDFFEKLIRQAMSMGTPRLRFRLGMGEPGSVFWLPWQDHIIHQPHALLESIGDQAGHTVELVTKDWMWLLLRGSKITIHNGLISDMVEAIAKAAGIESVVIEKTVGAGSYIQGYESLAEFIQQRLIPRAINEKARGNFLFYFRDNALHFHSPDYQAEVHSVVYYRDGGEAVTQFDNSQVLINEGIDRTFMVVYNPLTGETKLIRNDPEHALKLADSILNLNFPYSQKIMNYHQGANRLEETSAIVQQSYESSRIKTFALNLELEKTIQMRPGDFVNLTVAPSAKKASSWSGYYLISGLKHVVLRGSITTVYTLTRGEIQKSLTNTVEISGQEILVNSLAAPGQELNVAETKSSQRTKGTGKLSVDGRLYSTVLDPNV